ncbi:MAG TPA: hypothetical protein VFS80_11360 [Burkholderiales bacterium]|nr:hypothetical protein [Burkholderiales bacterium]
MGWMTRAAALVAAGALCACGGGGVGGGEGGGGATYSVATTSVSFASGQNGATPAPQVVVVTVHSGTVYVEVTQSGGFFSAVFDITGPTTGTVTITPSPPATPGVFNGTVTVRGCASPSCSSGDVAGSPKTINVTYTITGTPTASVTPTLVTFQGGAPAPQIITLSSSGGSSPWVSQIDSLSGTAGWLSATPSFGASLPQPVSLNVTASPVGNNTAVVTFTVGGSTTQVFVSYNVPTPRVNFVAPYVANSADAGSVIIRGHGFLGLAPATTSVSFGGTPATSVAIDSDTQIRADYPALAAGNYAVTVGDGTLTLASRPEARLVVVAATAYAYQAIPRIGPLPSHPVNLVYDAERRRVYLHDRDRNRLECFAYGVAWTAAGSLISAGGGGNTSIAMSPDGTVILGSGAGVLTHVNPATCAQSGAESPKPPGPLQNAQFGHLAFANDGRAVGNATAASGVSLYTYDMLGAAFVPLSSQFDMVNRLVSAPDNGSRILLPDFTPSVTPTAVFAYAASTGTLAATGASTSGARIVSFSRNGARVLMASFLQTSLESTTVYDASLTPLGTLPVGVLSAVVSPDGAYAYALIGNEIRKYDLNILSGGGFDEVLPRATVTDVAGTIVEMTISPDGGTLFLAGNQNLIVMPAP